MKGEFWRGRRVFVTGATGFLGSWLVPELLKGGAEIVILMRDKVPNSLLEISGDINKVNVVRGELENYPLIERILNEYEINTCFHLGAQAIVTVANRSPMSTFESDIRGTWNVLEAARNSKVLERLVIASSDKAYGEHEKLPYKETARLQAKYPYDVSKTCADMLAQSYFQTYGLPVGITRCGNFYGEGDLNFSRIVPGTIRSLIHNEIPIIRSDGTYVRDYIYIKDVVRAYMILAENLHRGGVKGEAFNFGTETPISVIDLVTKILDIYGKSDIKPKILGSANGEIKAQYLCSEKAKKILGWEHGYSLDKGLGETIEAYKNYFKEKQGGL